MKLLAFHIALLTLEKYPPNIYCKDFLKTSEFFKQVNHFLVELNCYSLGKLIFDNEKMILYNPSARIEPTSPFL